MSTRKPANTAKTRRSLGPALAAVTLVVLALGVGAQAIADGAVGPVGEGAQAMLVSDRDPDAFLADIAPASQPPVVLFTREDAVAREIMVNSRTLSQGQAMHTAQALCQEARRLGYDPLLFLAVIYVESSYNHLALSPVGAEGLMQLMPGTAEFLAGRGKLNWSDRQSFDPVLNVRLGVRYIAELNRMFHQHMDVALTAYNRGPANTRFIMQHHGALPAKVREFYAGRVLEKYRHLKAAYGSLPFA